MQPVLCHSCLCDIDSEWCCHLAFDKYTLIPGILWVDALIFFLVYHQEKKYPTISIYQIFIYKLDLRVPHVFMDVQLQYINIYYLWYHDYDHVAFLDLYLLKSVYYLLVLCQRLTMEAIFLFGNWKEYIEKKEKVMDLNGLGNANDEVPKTVVWCLKKERHQWLVCWNCWGHMLLQ